MEDLNLLICGISRVLIKYQVKQIFFQSGFKFPIFAEVMKEREKKRALKIN